MTSVNCPPGARDFTDAVEAGIVLDAARRSALHKKRHVPATRMRDRADDYPRFTHELRVPFGRHPDEQATGCLDPAS